jgi:hypothetical protein
LSLVFFTDRDLGKRFPEILTSAGVSVRRHDDLFPPDCPDELVATLPRITEFLAQREAPLIAKVYRPTPAEKRERFDAPGSVALWYPK